MEEQVEIMNSALLKTTFKSNLLIMIIIALVLLMYTSIMVNMFDPENAGSMADLMELMPESLMKAMGFADIPTDLTSFIANYLYGFIYVMFPMIYIIIVANNLVAKHVDRGSMVYLLSTPNSRIKIISTQALFMLVSLTVIFIFEVLMTIMISDMSFKGLLEINKYLMLNLITLLVTFAISSISFFFSCIFSQTKYSLAFGGGVPIAFFVIKMLSGADPSLERLQYFSLYSFIEVNKIFNNDNFVILSSLFLIVITCIFYVLGIIIFKKRSLII